MRIFALLLLCLVTGSAIAAPHVQAWERWTNHDPDSDKTIDHSAWTSFLQAHVISDNPQGPNLVAYAAVGKDDRKALRTYIHQLEKINIDAYARPVQRAFWTNLYNAVVMHMVLQHYPIDSVREIDDGLFGNGPWDDNLVRVGGEALSLNDIEYRILRPIWDDGLNSYALYKASIGGPSLLTHAYTGAHIWRQLRDNARAYVNSPRGVHFELDGRLTVSRIYKWHLPAYGNLEAGVITHLRKFAEPALSARLDAANGIAGYHYDWALNDTAETPQQ